MSDEDETPTPPATPRKPQGEPDRETATHDGRELLIYSERGGPYGCDMLEKLEGLTNTNQERYRKHELRLMPGFNYVFESLWDRVKTNRRLNDKVEASEIYIVLDFRRVRLNRVGKMIKESAHLPTLERLLKDEKREKVRELLIDHIAECKSTDGKAAAARKAQRAHHRRN